MDELKLLHTRLCSLHKQVRFATAQAITSTVRQIAEAQKETLRSTLDNPTNFTVNSVRSRGATRDSLTGSVFVMDIAAAYLRPFEYGGTHFLGDKKGILNPKNIRLNKHGNIPRNSLTRLKMRSDIFTGAVTTKNGENVRGVWQRKKARKSKKTVKKKRTRSPNGTRAPRKKSGPPKLLIRFGDALPVTPVLHYHDRAEALAKALMPSEMEKAMTKALKTAK